MLTVLLSPVVHVLSLSPLCSHTLTNTQEVTVDPSTYPPGEAGGVVGKRAVKLWADVARLAAVHKATDLVKLGAAIVRRLSWRPDVNREMIILQAEVDLLLAEVCACVCCSCISFSCCVLFQCVCVYSRVFACVVRARSS